MLAAPKSQDFKTTPKQNIACIYFYLSELIHTSSKQNIMHEKLGYSDDEKIIFFQTLGTVFDLMADQHRNPIQPNSKTIESPQFLIMHNMSPATGVNLL